MALGRRKRERQAELWVPTANVPAGPGHPFYERLNRLLAETGFDEYVEELCRPHYAEQRGRPSIPPGVYFRMLFVGYFEGLDSQRGIAWRCADSLALKAFLGYTLAEATPEHSSLTRVRGRLPESVHEQVFAFVLAIANRKKLLQGKTTGVDATLLEANAAMKSIVRRDTGEDYKDYLRRLAQEAGIDDPSDDDLKKFDKKRKKKMSNQEWVSPSDPDARIMKMKDGRTHLAHKAEHAVDLESGLLLAATIHHGDRSDGESLRDTLIAAQTNLIWAGSEVEIKNVPVDNGYHANAALAQCQAWGLRTYAAEKNEPHRRKWTDKPE
jgi:transposase